MFRARREPPCRLCLVLMTELLKYFLSYVAPVFIENNCFTLIHEKRKQNLIDVCITGKASVDKTEWVSSTCHSNLSDGKLPVCLKINKMNFPVKPECLNFTPLEERLCELPRGGQLYIHGHIVYVPADVNSLPKLINESQTIPVKLKNKLS